MYAQDVRELILSLVTPKVVAAAELLFMQRPKLTQWLLRPGTNG